MLRLGLGLGLTNSRRGGGGNPAIASWSFVSGSDVAIGNYSYFCPLTGNDFVALDIVANTLSTRRWTGSTFTVVGNALDVTAIGLSNSSGIVKLTSSKVVILDQANNLMRVYSWDGTDWSAESTTALTIATYANGGYLEDNAIAIWNAATNTVIKYTYDGSTTLTPAGYSLSISGSYVGVDCLSSTEIFIHSTAANTMYVYEDSGSAWVLKDSTAVPAATGVYLPCAITSTQAVYFSGSTQINTAVYNGADDISNQQASPSTLTGLSSWPRSLIKLGDGTTIVYHSWGDAKIRAATATLA